MINETFRVRIARLFYQAMRTSPFLLTDVMILPKWKFAQMVKEAEEKAEVFAQKVMLLPSILRKMTLREYLMAYLAAYPEDVFRPVNPAETQPLGGLSDRIAAHQSRIILRQILSDLEMGVFQMPVRREGE